MLTTHELSVKSNSHCEPQLSEWGLGRLGGCGSRGREVKAFLEKGSWVAGDRGSWQAWELARWGVRELESGGGGGGEGGRGVWCLYLNSDKKQSIAAVARYIMLEYSAS